ncbi:inositol 2-dehydrogenase [Rhodococcus sp. H29-C3]|uniref:inositol 2-dehydrogenase n=1 Tax=Rhodococcus sp. H29-C3 TaxID=3046307 RepID=UPI0024BB8EEF|nr:inositol 2-dehydrogenase [Rhodococcus sp. H29-C3]MDJ0358924.1 inositol 2-dehydrogenase [Rhodococcus sp. H29-C3]
MEAQHEPARCAWPDGWREHLISEFDGFSPLVTRALADNGASLFNDGPYARSGFLSQLRAFGRNYLWPS